MKAKLRRWKLCTTANRAGVFQERKDADGVVMVAEAFTKGEAVSLFKDNLGERPPKRGSRKVRTTRKRLPEGWRVREFLYGRVAT